MHIDIWRPYPSTIINRVRYFVLFVDNCTHFQWIFVLHNKSQVAQVFKHFNAYRERETI